MESSRLTREAWVGAALERYERPLLHYAVRITRDIESARDVVQETFLKLCEADPARVNEHLGQWLYTVCRNQALNVRQKEVRMTGWREEEKNAATGGNLAREDASAAASRNETHRRVIAIVEGLPREQQEAFWLKFRDGLGYREICGIMGVSLGTVSNWITSALDIIRHEMRPESDSAQEA